MELFLSNDIIEHCRYIDRYWQLLQKLLHKISAHYFLQNTSLRMYKFLCNRCRKEQRMLASSKHEILEY